jgi:preprotein translocase subunit Sss1
LNPSSSPILETHKKLKELKAIIEVNKKPKREKFLNQSLFEGKNQLSPML